MLPANVGGGGSIAHETTGGTDSSDGSVDGTTSDGGRPPSDPNNTITLNFGNYLVPPTQTNYICYGFEFAEKLQIIRFHPIVNQSDVLHHMILWAVSTKYPAGYQDCGSMPGNAYPIWVWAVGGEDFVPPDDVGIPVGPGYAQYIALQIHYNNPYDSADIYDSSGVEITTTPTFRPIEGGFIIIGADIPSLTVPPDQEAYQVQATCGPSQTNYLPFPIHLFAVAPHMHLTGYQIWGNQYRGSTLVEQTVCNDFWSFSNQNMIFINATLLPGDSLTVDCVYNTMNRTTVTQGCESTSCEMCMNIYAYYPLIPQVAYCFGDPVQVPHTNTSHCLAGG